MPRAPPASSIAATLPTAVVAANLLSTTASPAWTAARASAHRLPLHRTMPSASAFAASAPAHSSANATGRRMFSRFAWRPRRLPSSLTRRNERSYSVSSAPSVVSASSSRGWGSAHSDDSVDGGVRRYSTSKPVGSSDSGGGSKLSSSRGRAAIKLLPSYLIDARAITQYSEETPDGALQLSVAENQLSELPVKGLVGIEEPIAGGGLTSEGDDDLRLADVLSLLAASHASRPSDDGGVGMPVFDKGMIYYQPTQGVPSARRAMADYLQSLLVTPTRPQATRRFDPDNVVLGAGCNAVLENLCTVLADPGDAVLIPTPYYAAFEFDLVARAGCHVTPLNTLEYHDDRVPSEGPISAEFYCPNRSSLDAAYARAVGETGRPPRVLLLSHPNNPLGICYPPHVVEECIDWCREREVHLISDEIYAGSVYRKKTPSGEDTFASAMALGMSDDDADGKGLGLGPYVHLVYALSKDFALSGLRVGAAYTENEEILMPLQKLNDLCQISSQTQLLVERMLSANAVTGEKGDASRKFADVYLEANAANIRERCDNLMTTLDELDIPHLPADSGLFVWMDFREFLPPLPAGTTEANEGVESRERRERELYLSLMKEHGLLFTPGMSMRNERAGFFRCVFTAASGEEFELGLGRLRKFVEGTRG